MKKYFVVLTALFVSSTALFGCGGKAETGVSGVSFLTLGNQAMAAKDYKLAVKDYQKATKAEPDSAAPYQGLGTAYYFLGQKDKAINAYEKAVQLDPSNTRLSNFLAKLKSGN